MTANANAHESGQGLVGDDQNNRKEPVTMNTTSAPLTLGVDLAAWGQAITNIITAEQARLADDHDFIAWQAPQPEPWTVEDCMAKWITTHMPTLIEPPRPAWAESFEIDAISYSEIVFRHRSETFTAGDFIAHAERQIWFDVIENRIVVTEVGVNFDPDRECDGILSVERAQDMADVLRLATAVLVEERRTIRRASGVDDHLRDLDG